MLRLSEKLRTETKSVHLQVERSPFMQRMLKGPFSRDDYRRYLSSLLGVYEIFEDHPVFLPYLPEVSWSTLLRSARLRSDLSHLGGASGPGPLTMGYLEYLTVLRDSPIRMLGHVYCRYLGDLFGGQRLATLLVKKHGLAAIDFYQFEGVPAEIASEFRRALDRSVDSPEDQRLVVSEALEAFSWHGRIFSELEAASARPSSSKGGNRISAM